MNSTTPSRIELTQRSLNYLTQAETTLDTTNPTQNALIGIGYAILTTAQAITNLAGTGWDIVDEMDRK